MKNKDKILYINSLIEKGFVVSEMIKYPSIHEKLNNILNYQNNTIHDLNNIYNDFLNNIYSKCLDERYQKNSNFIHNVHREIYQNLDVVQSKIDAFIEEINTYYSGSFEIEDIILSPFFYQFGNISYGNDILNLYKYKINIIDLERCIYEYYHNYIIQSLNSIWGYKHYYLIDPASATEESIRLGYIYRTYCSLLFNTNVYNKIKEIIEKFYTDIKQVKNEIEKYKSKIDYILTNYNIYLDKQLLSIYDYNIYISTNVLKLYNIYNNCDKIDNIYEQKSKFIKKWSDILNNMITKWEDIVNKWEDTYNFIWKKLYS